MTRDHTGLVGAPAREPMVMGILNVTPDSFSDGGLHNSVDEAVRHAHAMVQDGAAIVDVGGESTRPGAGAVSVDEELGRVVPVMERLGCAGVGLCIDTSKATVAARAVELGASVVNDVTALRGDPELAGLCASSNVDVCLMHMRGEPRTMQEDPAYGDVVSEVKAFLEDRLSFAVGEGISEERIVVDPGIGFGKTLEHNLELIARLDEIAAIGRPVLIGTSRKQFLGALTGRAVADRLAGTVATCVAVVERGAAIVRVHDVAPVVDALKVVRAVETRG